MSSEEVLDHGILEEAISPLILHSNHPHSHVPGKSSVPPSHGSYNSVPYSLPGTRLPNKRALANVNKPQLERAYSFPEQGEIYTSSGAETSGGISGRGTGSGGSNGDRSVHGSKSSIERVKNVAAIYESRDGLRERTQHNVSATASCSNDIYGSPPGFNSVFQKQLPQQPHSQPPNYPLYQSNCARSTQDRTRNVDMIANKSPPPMRAHSSRGRVSDELLTDMNNVPQIDEAITPPSSPTPKIPLQSHASFADATPREPFHVRVANKIVESNRGMSKRFSSLKLRRSFTLGHSTSKPMRYTPRRQMTTDLDSPTSLSANPTITITMDHDRDNDSLLSDYLNTDNKCNQDPNMHYIGDDMSLYGAPKEDPPPFKEPDGISTSKTSNPTSYLKDQIIAFFQPSDNKLAMKLFGNKNALMKEKIRQRAAGNWVIHPCSNFRYVCRHIYIIISRKMNTVIVVYPLP